MQLSQYKLEGTLTVRARSYNTRSTTNFVLLRSGNNRRLLVPVYRYPVLPVLVLVPFMATCTGSTGTGTNILQPSSPTGHEYLAPGHSAIGSRL